MTASKSTPDWDTLQGMFGEAWTSPPPVSIDSVLHPEPPTFSDQRPTLFRERHGWCPYSERVWLTLEMLMGSSHYDTVRIDNTGGPRPSYYGGGQTPQMKLPEKDGGRLQGESYDLIQALDASQGYPLQSDTSQVNDVVNQFRNIFPRARPSSRAAYLFQYNGEPLWKSTFEETLQKTNDLLAQTEGKFFCGGNNSHQPTAADICWVPFLERYRYQLPCLHSGLEPDNPQQYPHLAEWYQAMEDSIPAYTCRVKGDASSWRKVLTMAGFGNAGVPPQIQGEMQALARREAETAAQCIRQDLWELYRQGVGIVGDDKNGNHDDNDDKNTDMRRHHVAESPAAEAALIMTRNRKAILQDIMNQPTKSSAHGLPTNDLDDLDRLLRELIMVLLETSTSTDNGRALIRNSEMVGKLASFLDERMCIPRDMGAMSAACIKDLAWKLSPTN